MASIGVTKLNGKAFDITYNYRLRRIKNPVCSAICRMPLPRVSFQDPKGEEETKV